MKWDRRFMRQAFRIAEWSKDPATKVGAYIADYRNRVVGQGYNGPPRGTADNPNIDRATKLRRTIHAELNAVLFAQRDLTGCTLYVTHHPCAQCAAVIVQAGITRVVYGRELSDKWTDDVAEAQAMFSEVGVAIEKLEIENGRT